MCVKNNTIIYVARASNSKRDCEHDLYCCLLPRCEALRTCRSGFPIASEQTLFQSTARVSRTAYYMAKNNKPLTNFESSVDLQEGNSIDMGLVLHSTIVAVDAIGRVSSQMKQKTFD